MGMWIVLLVVMVGMFWFTSRSNKKKQREEQNMRDSLAVGDEVTTIGGIIGKVVSIKGETFVLETTKQGTRIRFLKGAIRSVDVRVADIAASIAEEKSDFDMPEETVEEAPKKEKKSLFGRKKKEKAEASDDEASAENNE